MIKKETCADIWACYREIEAGEKIIQDIKEFQEMQKDNGDDQYAPAIKDAFGRKRHMQLGIPSGNNSHRLFQVEPLIAVEVIEAHIRSMKGKLSMLEQRAKIEVMETTATRLTNDVPTTSGDECRLSKS